MTGARFWAYAMQVCAAARWAPGVRFCMARWYARLPTSKSPPRVYTLPTVIAPSAVDGRAIAERAERSER
jgi:hypothetical protein